jgi:hypothetical protein
VEGFTVRRARSSLVSKIVLTALWLNFAAFWLRVYHLTSIADAFGSFVSLAVLISAYGVVVGWWIVHNLRIHRRKGPRRGARVVPYMATHDTLHRYISNKVDLHRGREILVDVIGDRKIFTAVADRPSAERVLAGVTQASSQLSPGAHTRH